MRLAQIRGRTARRLVAILTACLLLLVGLAWLDGHHDGSPTAAIPAPSPSGTVTSSQAVATPSAPSTAPRTSATTDADLARADPVAARREGLTRMLARRSAAVVDGDADAFMATVAPGAGAFRAAQATLFTNLSRLDPTVWRYEYGGDGGAVPAEDANRYGEGARLLRVELRYRLGAADPVDVVRHHWVVAVEHRGRWVLAGPGDDVGEGHESDADAWDLGPVTVARGEASLVVARSGGGEGQPRVRAAASYVEEADRAVRRVDAVWTGRWPERVVVVVPASQAEMARLLGQDGHRVADLDQIAAVTTGRVSGEPGPTVADRVIVNPSVYGELGALGRRVVLTHEVTHVATRASTTNKVPLWLSEGFADYVGYRGTGVTVAVAAADVLEAAREGHPPRRLPSDADFDPVGGDIAVAYEQAWLAARMVAETYGQERLVRLYEAASTVTGAEVGEAAADTALAEVLGLDRAAFVARWRAYIERLA